MSRTKKGQDYAKKPFESDLSSSDVFARLFKSMLVSDAWRDLTPQQRNLYVVCKLQMYDEKHKPNNDSRQFTMAQGKWSFYGLYDKRNGSGFRRDMEALILHGFIRCVQNGANTRTKSVYAYSDQWRFWGTEAFHVTEQDYTLSMLHKKRPYMADI